MSPDVKEVILQARVDEKEASLIRRAAGERDLTVAAFMRFAALREARSRFVHAWSGKRDLNATLILRAGHSAPYVLQRHGVGSGGEQTFLMLHGPGRAHLKPVSEAFLHDGVAWFSAPHDHAFALEGSADRWLIVRTTFLEDVGTEIVLRPEGASVTDAIRARLLDTRGQELSVDLVGGGHYEGRVNSWDCHSQSFEMEMSGGGKRTVFYDRVLSIGSPTP